MKVKFQNVKTGEMVEVNIFDYEEYTKYMTDKDYLLTI